jgi:GGDEF domain-containing protein
VRSLEDEKDTRAKAEEELIQLAFTDPLTGVYNLRKFPDFGSTIFK